MSSHGTRTFCTKCEGGMRHTSHLPRVAEAALNERRWSDQRVEECLAARFCCSQVQSAQSVVTASSNSNGRNGME